VVEVCLPASFAIWLMPRRRSLTGEEYNGEGRVLVPFDRRYCLWKLNGTTTATWHEMAACLADFAGLRDCFLVGAAPAARTVPPALGMPAFAQGVRGLPLGMSRMNPEFLELKMACHVFRLIKKAEENKKHSAMSWRCPRAGPTVKRRTREASRDSMQRSLD